MNQKYTGVFSFVTHILTVVSYHWIASDHLMWEAEIMWKLLIPNIIEDFSILGYMTGLSHHLRVMLQARQSCNRAKGCNNICLSSRWYYWVWWSGCSNMQSIISHYTGQSVFLVQLRTSMWKTELDKRRELGHSSSPQTMQGAVPETLCCRDKPFSPSVWEPLPLSTYCCKSPQRMAF